MEHYSKEHFGNTNTYEGEERGDVTPTVLEEGHDGVSEHHGNVVVEPVGTVDPADDDALTEADREQDDAAGRVGVEDLEHVHAALEHVKAELDLICFTLYWSLVTIILFLTQEGGERAGHRKLGLLNTVDSLIVSWLIFMVSVY